MFDSCVKTIKFEMGNLEDYLYLYIKLLNFKNKLFVLLSMYS